MLKRDVRIGGRYTAKVSNVLTTIRILSESGHGGWEAINESTGRTIRIRSAGKLREVAPTMNGQGVTVKQRDLIEKLLGEREVPGQLVAKITLALNNGTLNKVTASDVIKRLIDFPQREVTSNNQSRSTRRNAAAAANRVATRQAQSATMADDLREAVETAIGYLGDFIYNGAESGMQDEVDHIIGRLSDFLADGR